EPLTDEDRQPWLERLGDAIAAGADGEKPYILACSALKQQYRHFLAHCAQNVHFVYLKGSKDLIEKRLAARTHHFMSPSLLDSQFEALEEPQDTLVVDIASRPENIVAEIIRQLDLSRPQSSKQ
ncbi:MAG: gluconokinase, partial [Cyanobacteriota bacterium]|nr:gluconokinase [Cyanobacteriota bacterium]